MKVLIFNGSPELNPQSASELISNYIATKLSQTEIEFEVFNLKDAEIPMLDFRSSGIPTSVEKMVETFQSADVHIWLSPLYHGSIPGSMKNCLDWLEVSAKNKVPYLTDKTVGMICWADGVQAQQGINTMDAIAKALRAWTIPYNIPIVRNALMVAEDASKISTFYQQKLDLLINMAVSRKVETLPSPA